MPRFGSRSKSQLETCHPDLQTLFNAVIEVVDCSVTCGYRNERDQEKAFDSGNSKVHFPDGKHNSNPSTAVDVYPYWRGLNSGKIDFSYNKRSGVLDDLPHFELIT